MANVSITGDAIFAYSNNSIDDPANGNNDYQRVRLNVVGKAGDTKVTAVIRNNGVTRADQQGGNGTWDALQMDSLYLTTKAGPVNIKAGDFWGTIGLGARSQDAGKANALVLSTKAGPVDLAVFTHNGSADSGSGSTNFTASGKVAGATVKVVHNPHKIDGWTDFSVKGTFNGITVAAEKWDDKTANDNTTLIHVGGKAGDFNWDIAQLKNDSAAVYDAVNNTTTRNTMATGKLAPLGSMLIGKSARGVTSTAAADISNFTKIAGIAVSTKIAGNTIKAIYTKNTIGANTFSAAHVEDKITGTELILTRNVGGAMLTANLGKVSGSALDTLNATNKGIRFDVKF